MTAVIWFTTAGAASEESLVLVLCVLNRDHPCAGPVTSCSQVQVTELTSFVQPTRVH